MQYLVLIDSLLDMIDIYGGVILLQAGGRGWRAQLFRAAGGASTCREKLGHAHSDNRAIRLDVSHRWPPMRSTSA
jgi:hypothetical protein